MPMQVSELEPIQDKIINFLQKNRDFAYSSKEISQYLGLAHSTARKHLLILYKDRAVNRGKQKNYNKTYFYYME